MNNAIRLIGILIILSGSDYCPGQDGIESTIIDVEYWSPEGDTATAKAIYVNQYNYQFNIIICDTAGVPLSVLAPKDLAGFRYTSGNEIIEFTSLQNPEDMGRLFLRLVYHGKLSLYQLLSMNYSSTIISFNVSYYLWNNKWLVPPLTLQYEREALLKHFAGCPELEFKIKTGRYGLSNIRDIITEYEKCSLTDTYEFFYE
jgi:hypothetical protein